MKAPGFRWSRDLQATVHLGDETLRAIRELEREWHHEDVRIVLRRLSDLEKITDQLPSISTEWMDVEQRLESALRACRE